jgi:XTP/dITP diphosphohydrolase
MTATLASRNAHKARELEMLLPGWTIEPFDAEDWPDETGATYYDNALIKVRFAWHEGGWAIGEDSGIEVAALGGSPGIESARWTDDPVGRLLRELEGADDRRARYVCELVALARDGSEVHATGALEGSVALEARGSEGFGYDPIFVPDGEELTVAELGNAWKAEHSHRAQAARALAAALASR